MKQAQVLTDKDMKRVMSHIARSAFAERNRCALQLSWLAGMRVGEIAALNVGDVLDAEGKVREQIQLTAAQTKGDSARTVLLNAQAQAELAIYRKIAELLRSQAGWVVNDKRVERIWRREGLKVPTRQPKKGRLWLGDGSCIRLRAERPNHVWSYDFVEDRTHDGRKYRMLTVIDEFTHESLAIRVARKLKSTDVLDVLSDLFILRGVPEHIRSDNVLYQ